MFLGEDRQTAAADGELTDPVRILLVDDHLMVTEALASRLSAAMDLWVAGRCSTRRPQPARDRPRAAAGRDHD